MNLVKLLATTKYVETLGIPSHRDWSSFCDAKTHIGCS